jgi:ribulose-5-phosphate 4-epimerase/fuculose-1-phosphate aldolase
MTHMESELSHPDRNGPLHRELKAKLAAAFRIIARRKMDDGIAGHVSCRIPGRPDEFWVNPLGLFFEEITADDLLVVNHEGRILEGTRPYNPAAFAIHATLHAARPEVMAICHTHPPKGTAFAALGRPIKIVDQTSCSFYDDHALVAEYEGIVDSAEKAGGMARALEGKRAGILQNHGLITLGASVEQAVIDMLDLERTCELNLSLLACWDQVIEVPRETALDAKESLTSFARIFLQWGGLVRQIERQTPHYAGSPRPADEPGATTRADLSVS